MSAATTSSNDQQLLDIGKQCSDPLCRLVDFLPLSCAHCHKSFCQDHFKVDAHECTEYEEWKHNRVAPDCPFCKTPVAIGPNEDPNIRLERHFEKDCAVLLGKVQAKSSSPLCARKTCQKVLFSPIRCDTCRQVFCPSHRFPSDHTCKPPTSRLLNTNAGTSSQQSRSSSALPSLASVNSAAKNLNAKASEAVANVKKTVAATAVNATTPSTSAGKKAAVSTGPGNNPFKKTDRGSPPPPPPTIVSLTMPANSSSPPISTPSASSAIVTIPPQSRSPETHIPNPHGESETGPTPAINTLYTSYSRSFIPRSIFATA